jgi:hypothetical protein
VLFDFVPQRLAAAFGPRAGVHGERVANPEGAPARRAVGNLDGLGMDRHHLEMFYELIMHFLIFKKYIKIFIQ